MGGKPAKRRGYEPAHEPQGPKMVRLSGPHLIVDFIGMRAACGARLSGWRYGFPADVACGACGESARPV